MAKKKNKWLYRALCAALAVTLVSGMAVMSPVADIVGTSITANAADYNTWDTCQWKIEDGTLYIKGTIPDTGGNSLGNRAPWNEEKSTIKKVYAEPGTKTSADATFLFYELTNTTSMDLSNLDTSAATSMSCMFTSCSALTTLDLNGWDTGNVTDMTCMFQDCTNLATLDLSGWNTSSVTTMSYMFRYCSNLVTIYVSSDWTISTVTSSSAMFKDCTNIKGGNGTTYNSKKVNKSYAHIDGGTSNPGYFTQGVVKPKNYTVTWKNDDGTELGTNSVENGTSPVYDGETPTKESTAQYTYTFKGWTSDGGTTVYTDELPTGTENVTYTAVFEETVNEYTVTWQYDDGTVIDTETVAYGETPTHADATKEGCTFAGWTPEITAVTGNATYTAVFTYNDGVGRLAGYTLSLDGDIGLNFYTELAPEIAQSETAVMHFTVSNGSKTTELDIPVSQATVKGNYYIFKCNVAAKDMNAVITGQIIDGDNVGTEYSYSVKDYANYLIENADENGTDRQKEYAAAAPLAAKMLQYGAYAKDYFDKTNTLGNLDDVNINIADPVVGEFTDDTTFEGATLSLKSETTLSLYFRSSEPLEFACAGYDVETITSGDYQVARIRGIKAKHIGDIITLNVNGVTVEYSPLNYCKNVLDSDNQPDSLKNTVKALYLYWQAADNYFG